MGLPYSSALRPHSRIGRTPDFGGKKEGGKNGGKNEEKSLTPVCYSREGLPALAL